MSQHSLVNDFIYGHAGQKPDSFLPSPVCVCAPSGQVAGQVPARPCQDEDDDDDAFRKCKVFNQNGARTRDRGKPTEASGILNRPLVMGLLS